jgi:phage gpG-like protein
MATGPGVRVTAKVVGIERQQERFRALARSLQGDELLDCITAGALLVENAAKTKCPVGKILGGTLRRSIHTEGRRQSDTNVYALVGTDVVYARRIEYGFAGRDSLGRLYDQAAQPYLRPALDEKRDAVRREIRAAIEQKVAAVR